MALDTTRTPFKTVEMVLGGSASFFSLAASFFTDTYACAVVGEDFPEEYWQLLSKKIDLSSVERKDGKTFHFDSTFSFDLYHRHANKTELNVLADFEPKLSEEAKNCDIVFLASMQPSAQLKILEQTPKRKFSFMDTIEFFIKTELDAVLKTMKHVDGVVLNDVEARMIGDDANLIKCGKKIHSLGPKIVIIKKGEHGSLLFHDGKVMPFPAFPLEVIVDPTGAGDAFAGGFLGALARASSVSGPESRNSGHIKQDWKLETRDFKIAMAYANVMGSLAVEDFSVNRLANATKEEVEKRFNEYCELLKI